MKRIRLIIIGIIAACVFFLSALPIKAAEALPDWTISATFNGGLRLSPKNVTFSSESNIGPGDSYTSRILFQNNTDRTVEFSLRNILNLLPDNPKSLYMLGGLDATISVGGNPIYSGTYAGALGLSSEWYSVDAGGQLPVQISYRMPINDNNSYQSLTFKVNYVFDARSTDASGSPASPGLPAPPERPASSGPPAPPGPPAPSAPPASPGPPAPSAPPAQSGPPAPSAPPAPAAFFALHWPETGAGAIAGNTIDAWIYPGIASAAAAALILVLVYCKKKKSEKENQHEKQT